MPLTLGAIAYVCLLLVNSIASKQRFPKPRVVELQADDSAPFATVRAVLSHDRFLVPLGLSASSPQPSSTAAPYAYGTGFDSYGHPDAVTEGPGVKQRLVTLVGAVRTVMRSESNLS